MICTCSRQRRGSCWTIESTGLCSNLNSSNGHCDRECVNRHSADACSNLSVDRQCEILFCLLNTVRPQSACHSIAKRTFYNHSNCFCCRRINYYLPFSFECRELSGILSQTRQRPYERWDPKVCSATNCLRDTHFGVEQILRREADHKYYYFFFWCDFRWISSERSLRDRKLLFTPFS